MNARRTLALAALVLAAGAGRLAAAPSEPLGSALRPGMVLEYESLGQPQPEWRVDSLRKLVRFGGRDSCTILRLVIAGSPPAVQERIMRRDGDVLMGWDRGSKSWRPQRPLAPGKEVDISRGDGRVTRFAVEGTSADTVSGRRYATLVTTAITYDSLGVATYRLRERFAPSLATAIRGVFERRDSTAAGGWRLDREFHLARIR